MKSKMHKYELAKSKTTENAAVNSIRGTVVNDWLTKVRNAERAVFNQGGGVQTAIDAQAKVLVDLITGINTGKIEREVADAIIRHIGIAPLARAKQLMDGNNLRKRGV